MQKTTEWLSTQAAASKQNIDLKGVMEVERLARLSEHFSLTFTFPNICLCYILTKLTMSVTQYNPQWYSIVILVSCKKYFLVRISVQYSCDFVGLIYIGLCHYEITWTLWFENLGCHCHFLKCFVQLMYF